MNNQLKAIVPIMFEVDEYYFGYGTSFIVSLKENYYLVTAKHVFENQNVNVLNLRAFVSESKVSLCFDQVLDIQEAEEFSDLFIARIAIKDYFAGGGEISFAQDLFNGFLNCSDLGLGCSLFIVGYPESGSSYDYQNLSFKKTLTDYEVTYKGSSQAMLYFHKVSFEEELPQAQLNGLSGAPIYFKRSEQLLLVGVMVRASAKTGYFIDVGVLQNAIDKSIC